MKNKWCGLAVLGPLLVGCATTRGVIGPQGYEQTLVKYQVGYLDASKQSFLPDDWAVDNYARNSSSGWDEKTKGEYQALRALDEDGDGEVSTGETQKESVFDLRFVNAHDNAVIWLKMHALTFADSQRELEVILDNYADGLAGTGLFEQSTLFGLKTDHARHYTTFVTKKEGITLGQLGAVLGVIEVADVEKLRLDPTHRDSKIELVVAKVRYRDKAPSSAPTPYWPTEKSGLSTVDVRTGLLVIGYYDSASRFASHQADFDALLTRIRIPSEALLPDNARPQIHDLPPPPAASAPTPAPARTEDPAPPSPQAPSPAVGF